MLRRWFLDHPHSVGESYLEHQRTAFSFSGRLLLAGIACFIHGLIPCLFERTASRAIAELNARVTARQIAATIKLPAVSPPGAAKR